MGRIILNPPVATGSLIIVAALLLFGGVWPDTASRIFEDVQSWVLNTFGWLYVLAVASYTVAALIFAFSRFGQIKLGPDDSEPEFSFVGWSAMLFAAGVGIGLMFYGVAEPISHYVDPPTADPRTVEAQREAMVSTFFHWGINAWAIFSIVGLSLAYFGYRYNLPLTIRSGLYPLLKDRIHGPIGHAVDIFAVCGTLFGIATSLGLGVLQMNSGLDYLFGVDESTLVQVLLIVIVMAVASVSVVAGLDKGVRRLSEFNLMVAILLVLFVLLVGPTLFLIKALLQNTGMYLDEIVPRTFTMYAYEPTEWLNEWTLFYWGWWISWSPFVGMFIARISRGRTVREFVLGVLLVPTALIVVWMTVFGNSAFFVNDGEAQGALATAVEENISVALFQFLDYLPLSALTSGLALILIAVFFVTSADSGSLVLDMLASGGNDSTPAYQRVFWCALEAAVASILLVAGGLTALQTATIASALPFAVVIILLCFGLWRGLSADLAGQVLVRQQRGRTRIAGAGAAPWRRRLATLVLPPTKGEVQHYLVDTARPALEQVASELSNGVAGAEVREADDGYALVLPSEQARDFVYGVRLASAKLPAFVLTGVGERSASERRVWLALTHFTDGRRGYNVMGYSRDQLINDVIDQYEIYRLMLRSPQSELFITSPDRTPERPPQMEADDDA